MVGDRHIHHFLPGGIIALAAGGIAIGTKGDKLNKYLAFPFGVGVALVLDESALLLELDDVYWTEEGVLSVQIAFAAIAMLSAHGLPDPDAAPQRGRGLRDRLGAGGEGVGRPADELGRGPRDRVVTHGGRGALARLRLRGPRDPRDRRPRRHGRRLSRAAHPARPRGRAEADRRRSCRRTSTSASASSASRASRRRSITRTRSRSTTRARATACSTSRCGSSTGTDLRELILKRGSAAAGGGVRDRGPDRGRAPRRARARDRPPRRQAREHPDRATAPHAYLTDFGLTKSADAGSMLTRSGMIMGSFDYIAPEQLDGGDVDARTDVYALGCVIYEALDRGRAVPARHRRGEAVRARRDAAAVAAGGPAGRAAGARRADQQGDGQGAGRALRQRRRAGRGAARRAVGGARRSRRPTAPRRRRALPVPLPPALEPHAGEEPFVGREAAFAQLREAFERARGGERALVLLSGEPGMGKSRLAREIARHAHAQGAHALFGSCDEEPIAPYQPFTEAGRYYLVEVPGARARRRPARPARAGAARAGGAGPRAARRAGDRALPALRGGRAARRSRSPSSGRWCSCSTTCTGATSRRC